MVPLKTLALTLLLAYSVTAGAQAQTPEQMAEISTHLEFLGYEVKQSEANLTATNNAKLDILVQTYQGGLLMQSFLSAKGTKDDLLPMANLLNTGAAVARFYVDTDGDLVIEAWTAGDYDKTRFATFLEAWDADTVGQFRAHSDEFVQLFN
ncbi:MAG: hypothetical protein ACR2QM_20650 [Longimicrobiales bacterium]